MCCDDHSGGWHPAAVDEMLAGYRQLQSTRAWDWGRDWQLDPRGFYEVAACRLPVPLARLVIGRPELVEVSLGHLGEAEALRRCFGGAAAPAATTFVTICPRGVVDIRSGEAPWAIEGHAATRWLVMDSQVEFPLAIVVANQRLILTPHALEILPITIEAGETGLDFSVDGRKVHLADVVRRAGSAEIVLRADAPARWSVVDGCGGAWFPDGAPPKWDCQYRPFFHGQSIALEVPATPLNVVVARGIECDPVSVDVRPRLGTSVEVELSPRPRIHPNADGWFSADLHVHTHYSGDLVITPEQATCMQVGEGLNVMSLLAANLNSTRVYDREAFEALAGQDLPSTSERHVTRYGIEFRNDLLGHFHALAPSGPPARYQTGHVPEEGQEDWPPNAVACDEQRRLGATVGYAHPVWRPFDADGTPTSAFKPGILGERSVEARELVADAALGLVDSIDLLHYGDWEASAQLYHHLLGCGIRLAASVGTDVFLSISHGLNSDPPGWARMYAQLDGEDVTADAYKRAIRAGKTIATNGPWISLEVAGHGPGSVIDARIGEDLELEAECSGPGVLGAEIIGPDGTLAQASAEGDRAVVVATYKVKGPMWIAARGRGREHPSIMRGAAWAHTSPVYVDVAGQRVGRGRDAAWCLDWLDRFETLLREYGRYSDDGHRDEVIATIEGARAFYRGVMQRPWTPRDRARPTPGSTAGTSEGNRRD